MYLYNDVNETHVTYFAVLDFVFLWTDVFYPLNLSYIIILTFIRSLFHRRAPIWQID